MNSRNIILSGLILALVMLVTTNVFFTSGALAVGIGVNETPSGGLSVYTIKKAALICDSTGGQVPPQQNFPEIGGCVDVLNRDPALAGDLTDFRYNEYMFTGEQLAELVVARDLSGAQFLGSTANMLVNGTSVVTCTKVDPANIRTDTSACSTNPGQEPYVCSWTNVADCTSDPHCQWNPSYAYMWYGHDITGLLAILPPKQGISDKLGFDPATDVLYQCIATVGTGSPWNGNSSMADVKVQVGDGTATASTVVQEWYFNPAISINVYFDSGTSVMFPPAQPGQTVYSTNTLKIKNTAMGGVDLAVYLAGNNLQDTSGIGLCPDSNFLSATNIAYRCKVGTYMSEQFTPLQLLNTKDDCVSLSERQCLVDGPGNNDLLPDAVSEFTSILYNGHTAECWFQLNVPVPCIGSFSAADAVDVLVRAI